MELGNKVFAATFCCVFVASISFAQDLLTTEQADQVFKANAEKARLKAADLSFEQFKATVYKEPGEDGKYIVDGDTPINNDKELKEFYEENILKRRPSGTERLAVMNKGGVDAVWSNTQKRALTYCVSTDFVGVRYEEVVADMNRAALAWESSADINFIHLSQHDSNCNALNNDVLFNVNPVKGQRYLARAFFPGDSRRRRNILINESSFMPQSNCMPKFMSKNSSER